MLSLLFGYLISEISANDIRYRGACDKYFADNKSENTEECAKKTEKAQVRALRDFDRAESTFHEAPTTVLLDKPYCRSTWVFFRIGWLGIFQSCALYGAHGKKLAPFGH